MYLQTCHYISTFDFGFQSKIKTCTRKLKPDSDSSAFITRIHSAHYVNYSVYASRANRIFNVEITVVGMSEKYLICH